MRAGPEAALAPARRSTRLTAAGRAALPVAGASLISSWMLGGVAGLFASTAVAALLCAYLLARLSADGLRVAPPPPARAHVGDPFPLEVLVLNRGRRTARHVRLLIGEGDVERVAGHLGVLAAGAHARVRLEHRSLRRGRRRRLALVVASTFPLGLVERRLAFDLAVDLLALPRLGTLADLGRLPAGRRAESARVAPRFAGDEELSGVRAWREGESLRRVHWRLSARRGRRVVREMRREEEPPVRLVLAAAVPRGVPFDAPRRAFERAVALAATLAEHYLRRGHTVRLVLAREHAERDGGPARGRAGLLRVLTALAEVEPEEGDPRRAVERALGAAASGEACIALYAGDGAREPRREGGPTPLAARRPERLSIDVAHPAARRLVLPGRAWGSGTPLAAAAPAEARW